MSFYVVWNKPQDDCQDRPSTVVVPSARDVSYHSALITNRGVLSGKVFNLALVRNPGSTEIDNLMYEMLLACLKASTCLPNLEYYHISKMSSLLQMACDSKHVWFSILQTFRYRSQFERRMPDLLLTIADFDDADDKPLPEIKRVDRAKIKLGIM